MAITLDTGNARRPGRTPAVTVARVSQRARAFAVARRHSRLVAVLRIVCPLVAIGIVGVYALIVAMSWAKNAGKFRVGGVEITADDLTMKDASYFDVTSDGRYEVRAKRAVVAFNQNAPIKLIDVSGDLTQTNGVVTKLKAKHGLFENKKGELELFDGIEIDGSNGVMARLSRAMFYSKEGKVVSTDPVSATMPTGSVQAAAMTMHNKTKLVQFRGNVAVRLVPQQGQTLSQTLGTGKDARQPVDIRAEELDIDDAAKAAHFRGKVVAVQGETMLQAPYLMVKYEGKAADGLASGVEPSAGKDAGKEAGTRVTFLWARNGVEVTAGTDRRITSDLADFDIAADTALFAGNVVATQEKNVLKGGRLLFDRKAGRTRLETPGNGRIAATFHQSTPAQARPARRPTGVEEVHGAMLGSFKADRNAPMQVDADTLELHGCQQQGDLRRQRESAPGRPPAANRRAYGLLLRSVRDGLRQSRRGGGRQGQGAREGRDRAPGGQAQGDLELQEPECKRGVGGLQREGQHGAARGRGNGHARRRRPAQARCGQGRAPQGGPDDRHLPGRGRRAGVAATAAAPASRVIQLCRGLVCHAAGEGRRLSAWPHLHPAPSQAGQGKGHRCAEEEGAGHQCAVTGRALRARFFAIFGLQ